MEVFAFTTVRSLVFLIGFYALCIAAWSFLWFKGYKGKVNPRKTNYYTKEKAYYTSFWKWFLGDDCENTTSKVLNWAVIILGAYNAWRIICTIIYGFYTPIT